MKRAHIMGIEGVGMSALARLLQGEGVGVTGCDLKPGARASALGVPVFPGHDPAHLGEEDTLVVPTPVPLDHPEVVEARRRGMRVLRRMELLAHLLAKSPPWGSRGPTARPPPPGCWPASSWRQGWTPGCSWEGSFPSSRGTPATGRAPAWRRWTSPTPFSRGCGCGWRWPPTWRPTTSPPGQQAPNYHGSLEELEAAMRGFLAGAEVAVVPAFDPTLLRLSQGLHRRLFGQGGELWAEGWPWKPREAASS